MLVGTTTVNAPVPDWGKEAPRLPTPVGQALVALISVPLPELTQLTDACPAVRLPNDACRLVVPTLRQLTMTVGPLPVLSEMIVLSPGAHVALSWALITFPVAVKACGQAELTVQV